MVHNFRNVQQNHVIIMIDTHFETDIDNSMIYIKVLKLMIL